VSRRGALLVRGMRWRLGASLLTVLAATIAVATAVLGPLYLHTAGDSVVRRTVAEAPVQTSGLTLALDSTQTDALAHVQHAVDAALALGRSHRFYGAPLISVVGQSGADGPHHAPYGFAVIARTGICHVLHFTAGRCVLGAGDTVVSARSARRLGDGVGSVVHTGLALKITGIYTIPNLAAPYWWGEGQSAFAFGTSPVNMPPQLDPLFVSEATALSVRTPESVNGPAKPAAAVTAQVPLVTGHVDLADEAALKRTGGRIDTAEHALGIMPVTGLPSVLGDADHQRHQMTTIIAVAAVQLVLLAVWVLGSLLVRSAEARQAEARAARLRGFPMMSLLWVTAAEPGLLCLVGVLLGVALAWVTVVGARASLLAHASVISFDGATIAALALTVVAILGALGIGSARLLRSTRLSQGAATPGDGSLAGRVADAVLIVLAVTSLAALGTTGALNGHSDPLAAAAPGLIALGTAVVAVQLMLLACRAGISVSGDSRRVAMFLALRQTARRPGVLRQARVLVIALGLACFAVAAWSIGHSNRASAADFQVGARDVVTVAPTSPTALSQAVDRVDPHGRYAMAAVTVQTQSSSLLAVDAPRLHTAGSWPRGISTEALSAIVRAIDPPTAPAVKIPRAPIHVTATVSATGGARARLTDVDLDLWVANASAGTNIVALGGLRAGQRIYSAPDTVDGVGDACPGGCRLAGVGIISPPNDHPPASGAVTVAISRLGSGPGAGRILPADLAAGQWRSEASGVRVAVHAGAVTLTVPAAAIDADESADGAVTPPMAGPADHPAVLPAVATPELEAINATLATGTLPTEGLDGTSLDVHPTATVSALPRLGSNATMVDLGLLSRLQTSSSSPDLTDEVWLGPRAPTNALARLRGAGLDPTGTQRAATVLARMQRTGPALADDFLLFAAIAALLVAAASTLSALGATTRERATELASLQVAGVSRAALARSLSLESAILLITALSGAGAGILAAVLAVPSLPERAVASLAPAQFSLPIGAIALVAAAALIAVALAAGTIAAVLLRRMSPILLRTAPDDISL
jgi:putative ABC transport system permease protein